MSFRSPLVLVLAAVLVPAAWAAFAYAARRRREALALFLGARSGEGGPVGLARQRRIRAGLLVAAVALVGVALAGPRAGAALRESRQESLDLLIALDVSDSMRAEDVAPSRLERAKLEIERIVEARRGDRVGLVVFAGEAFLQCPLTTDRGALRLFLSAADPEQVAVQGTDFARALAVADAAFNAASDDGGQARPRALLVVSDGEDHEGGLGAEADALREDGVEVFALGVGTDEGGTVPEVRRGRSAGVKRDRSGQAVVSRYEEGALRDLAGRDGVFRVGRRPAADAVNRALDRLDRAVVAEDEFAAEAERFQWPLGLALLLLVAERLVALRRPDGDGGPGPETGDGASTGDATGTGASRPSVAVALVALVLGGCAEHVEALAPGAREGRAAVASLEAGDPVGAEAQLTAGIARPDVPRALRAKLWHTLGVARAAQDGREAGADSAFSEALAFVDDPASRARYAYDAGTAALLAGAHARADSLLRVALLLDPTSPQTRRNQEIARRLLEDPPEPPEPSDFARRVKARADSLVEARQYGGALDVMREGLAQDSSVAAYADFTQRLSGVVQIEETAGAVTDSP